MRLIVLFFGSVQVTNAYVNLAVQITPLFLIVWLLTEVTRLILGYYGNLQEKVAIAGFPSPHALCQ